MDMVPIPIPLPIPLPNSHYAARLFTSGLEAQCVSLDTRDCVLQSASSGV